MVMHQNKKGFAYLLLLIFLVSLSVFALEVQPYFSKDIIRRRQERLFAIMREYHTAIRKFKSYYGRYPGNLSDLASSPPAPRFIRKFYRDPVYKTGDNKTLQWDVVKKTGKYGGIISVKSKSDEISLGGIPYNSYFIDEKGVMKNTSTK